METKSPNAIGFPDCSTETVSLEVGGGGGGGGGWEVITLTDAKLNSYKEHNVLSKLPLESVNPTSKACG